MHNARQKIRTRKRTDAIIGGKMQTYAYGFPRLGKNREYKKIIEKYWKGKSSKKELLRDINSLDEARLSTYEKYADMFPVGEMTLYCNMLDTAIMVGLYDCKDIDGYYSFCRGKNALKLTKWFNTNYHYLVPEFAGFSPSNFTMGWNKPKEALQTHKKGIPYLIGPFTFLKLSKGIPQKRFGDYLFNLIDVYKEIIQDFDKVHIDEPAFVAEVSEKDIKLIKEAYRRLDTGNIYLFTYYDSVDFLDVLYELPIKAIGLDFLGNEGNLKYIEKHGFASDKYLIAGVVNGRNVWKTSIKWASQLLKHLSKFSCNLVASNSSPLYHLPITIEEERLDERLLNRLAFAKERLYELKLIASCLDGDYNEEYNSEAGDFGRNEEVREKVKNLSPRDFKKEIPYPERVERQKNFLCLPLFPSTTIGSFPQTKEVREKRRDFKRGNISNEEYNSFIRKKISDVIRFQENSGLDVLVHGEFERTDMVEFFALKLQGFVTTKNGWIISYGTRGYRPPIIYGDISRPKPMSVDEITFAQSLTKKPVKGILTGPITMIAWSFVRENVPIREVAYQIALCLNDEIKDLERSGIRIIQIDEPAFRERAPIKRRDWDEYFDWAIKSFILASKSNPETQIHTHMCYSEFGEIIDMIKELDFDVISIEATRSKGDIIRYFKESGFDRQIGPGVWDVHSPDVPTVEDIKKVIKKAMRFIPKGNLWINPDCGLKTRDWKEVVPSIKNMVKAAKELRNELKLNA
jgi:5-methyltetrahydropteroyltriglutamate--homocysteine methyltransferase